MGRDYRFLLKILRISTFIFLFNFIYFESLWAYVPTITGNGTPIRWKAPVKLNFAGNLTNQSGLNWDQLFNAAVLGLQRWQYASSSSVTFDYWQGTNTDDYPPNSDYNGVSSIYFSSNANTELHLSPNVLGMTQVWYNTNTGEILETDIVLNDKDFNFTNNPSDTSGYGSGATTYTRGKSNVYVQNVITHELGHALGLSHSGGLQSTMLFMESPEQAHLGCDELIAIHALYPATDQNSRGGLSGQIISESSKPVFGAHVLAISQTRGTVLATAITDKNGKYSFSALEPGPYYLMAEPFYAGPQALPIYYADSSPSFCPEGNSFSRSFLTNADNITLTRVEVRSSQISNAPQLIARCNNSGGASVVRSMSMGSSNLEQTINLGEGGSTDFGIVDQLNPSQVHYYKLVGVSGYLAIHAVSYSLYSPINPSLSLISSDGKAIQAKVNEPVYRGDSGYINHDSALVAEDLPPGDYILKISSSKLQPNDYPAGPISLDSIPFLIVSGTLNEKSPPFSATLPYNARCRLSEEFPAYQSPPGRPTRSQNYTEQSSGGCGITRDESGNPKGPMPPGSLVGWALSWGLVLGICRFWIRLHSKTRPVNLNI